MYTHNRRAVDRICDFQSHSHFADICILYIYSRMTFVINCQIYQFCLWSLGVTGGLPLQRLEAVPALALTRERLRDGTVSRSSEAKPHPSNLILYTYAYISIHVYVCIYIYVYTYIYIYIYICTCINRYYMLWLGLGGQNRMATKALETPDGVPGQ